MSHDLLQMPAKSATLSRRSALRLIVGSGIVGGSWGTGFTALNGIRPPSATVCGSGDWQLTLFESGRSRSLVLMGIPDPSIDDTLTRVMGSFRQRIDIVIGAPGALKPLAGRYWSRWNVQRTIMLGVDAARPLTARSASIAFPAEIHLSDKLTVSLIPANRGRWRMDEQPLDSLDRWIISAEANGSTVHLAEQLEDIASSGLGPSAVTIAPSGDLGAFWSSNPASAVAVNNDHVPRDVITSPPQGNRGGSWLVPVYPEDVAHFAFEETGVGLPQWARSVQFSDRQT